MEAIKVRFVAELSAAFPKIEVAGEFHPRPEQQQACRSDYFRFRLGLSPTSDAVVACLGYKKSRPTPRQLQLCGISSLTVMTLRRTRSAASADNRSTLFSAQRYAIASLRAGIHECGLSLRPATGIEKSHHRLCLYFRMHRKRPRCCHAAEKAR